MRGRSGVPSLTSVALNFMIFIPTLISLLRVLLTPVFGILFMQEDGHFFSAVLIFSVAAITDSLDGHVARRYGLISRMGAFIDPLADKVLIGTTFVLLWLKGLWPGWVVCVVIGRDIVVTGLRLLAEKRGLFLPTSWIAKCKTVAQFIAIYVSFASLIIHDLIPGGAADGIVRSGVTVIVYVVALYTIYTGFDYLVTFREGTGGNGPSTFVIPQCLATCCGLGYSPVGPGTVTSLAAVISYYWIMPPTIIMSIAVLMAGTAIAIFVSDCVVKSSGIKDPSFVVIDELIGMGVALIGIDKQLWTYGLAFLLFRFFDILKPFPIKKIEQLPGGWGVVLDDVAAGLLALGCLKFLLLVWC